MRAFALLVLTFVFAVPAAAAPPIKATLTTTTPTPVVDRPWRYTVVVRSAAGKPIAARMRLQILLGPTVVGCWKRGQMAQCLDGSLGDWIAFRGKRTGVLTWPAESVGVRLTFRAVVKAGGQTRRLRAPVTVKPAP
ncbi:MAG TPA: hypothetical protein VK926_01190 [Gaiellaceae bacterium]|nr:hypothetical protein [Gaiellaceae bacterium]